MNPQPSGSQAVARAGELLVRIIESENPPSVSELADAAGLPKSTTSRLLRALEDRRLVQRDGSRGTLRPGPVLVRYARRTTGGADLVDLAAAALDELAERTGETINLAVPGRDGVEHLAQRNSRFIVGSANWVGRPVPFHAAANGKVFLAFGAARLARGDLERLTDRTIVDRDLLAAELAAVKECGWAVSDDELEPGLRAVAAPVHDEHGEVIAALSVSAPGIRLSREELVALGPEVARIAATIAERRSR